MPPLPQFSPIHGDARRLLCAMIWPQFPLKKLRDSIRASSLHLEIPISFCRQLHRTAITLGVFFTIWPWFQRNRCCSVSWHATDLAEEALNNVRRHHIERRSVRRPSCHWSGGISRMASTDARSRSYQRTSTTDALKINTLTRWRNMSSTTSKENARDYRVDRLGFLALVVAIIAVHDLTQRQHAVTRNFPVIGHFRYFFEEMGQPLRQ